MYCKLNQPIILTFSFDILDLSQSCGLRQKSIKADTNKPNYEKLNIHRTLTRLPSPSPSPSLPLHLHRSDQCNSPFLISIYHHLTINHSKLVTEMVSFQLLFWLLLYIYCFAKSYIKPKSPPSAEKKKISYSHKIC